MLSGQGMCGRVSDLERMSFGPKKVTYAEERTAGQILDSQERAAVFAESSDKWLKKVSWALSQKLFKTPEKIKGQIFPNPFKQYYTIPTKVSINRG